MKKDLSPYLYLFTDLLKAYHCLLQAYCCFNAALLLDFMILSLSTINLLLADYSFIAEYYQSNKN